MSNLDCFNPNCQQCPRLAEFLTQVRQQYPHYHAQPVAPFGDDKIRLLVVGLAPGMHGANATGRPFTGDFAGLLLYQTLFDFGFSNQPEATSANDGLQLINCRISNAVKCLPPQNKPTPQEIRTCNHFLAAEIAALPPQTVILALGNIAHQAVLMACGLKVSASKFAHGAVFPLPNHHTLVSSYHTSRYNVQTRRIDSQRFADIFKIIQQLMA